MCAGKREGQEVSVCAGEGWDGHIDRYIERGEPLKPFSYYSFKY